MARKPDPHVDDLFLIAEQMATDSELFPESDELSLGRQVDGLLSPKQVKKQYDRLQRIAVDDYIAQAVAPAEDPTRVGAREILESLPGEVHHQAEHGPLIMRELSMDFGGRRRRVGIIAQERTASNGIWMPEHHLQAAAYIRDFADHATPVVTLIDTIGADAGADANARNQAHAISRLIAEFAQIDIPTVGVIIGNGYSGGAIPLATTNLLLSVRDGVFNTILPRGLANIARKYDLSWQECARYVGVSACELFQNGYIDGIIDYAPGEERELQNLHLAIISGIQAVETAATQFAANNPSIFEHYQRSISRYLTPSKNLETMQNTSDLSLALSPTNLANVFGLTYRFMRFLTLRRRIHHSTVERYGHLADLELPRGDLAQRTEKEHQETFNRWLGNALEIKYDDALRRLYLKYSDKKKDLPLGRRNRVGQFFLGDPRTEWGKAMRNLCLEYSFHLYNLWKDSAQTNFAALIKHLADEANQPGDHENTTVLDVILQPEIRGPFIAECRNILLFDDLYANIIKNLKDIASEAKDSNTISRESIRQLLEQSLTPAIDKLVAAFPADAEYMGSPEELREQFDTWLAFFSKLPKRERILKTIQQWKKVVFPRVPEPLFAIVTFLFERLIPDYLRSVANRRYAYRGNISLRNIGIKDFWNRLAIAYHDLLIQNIQFKLKKDKVITSEKLLEAFFKDFSELNGNLMSADPAAFPGFRLSIERALSQDITPCGTITGIAEFKYKRFRRQVGVLISNTSFQAGAFDMASAEKFCKLLLECARRHLPVIGFVASSGMQTKEGAGALFSMSIVNDRITRFIRDNDLPIIMFGFGDCTGGAQASLVTHPMVQTYYLSGTNMPFAGQIVVPSYLPCYTTLSNYLSLVPGAMQGLVKHPFAETLDDELRLVDPQIPVPTETVPEVVVRVLKGSYDTRDAQAEDVDQDDLGLMQPIQRILVHARGCTAQKIVRKVQEAGKPMVLVQSDADMESEAAKLLAEQDLLVCIGGNTPDESYLNAKSVIRIAEREKADALHPGIGFLSENPDFAALCRRHGINFIGPPVQSMEWMGNKSNATNTAREQGVPVVPGSYGVLTDSETAAELAAEIGYPVILKAVHGGGGKGIQVVREPQRFRELFLQIAAEAKSAFGSSDVYLEKFVESMRHVEIQILRDKHGNTRVLGLRDCSVQRNNQKVVEESGSTLLPDKLKKAMFKHAASIADRVGYVGAGTVEFIFDLPNEAVYFMEMNARLQIEHPVTEMVTGVDIVKEQIRIAEGRSIEELKFRQSGYAIEVRINAEKAAVSPDGDIQFIPDPGKITECRFPKKPHIQILTAVSKGQVIPPYYDSMIVQVICKGKDREDTIDKLLAYLDDVKLRGVCTNIPLVKRILADDVFRGGDYDTGYLPEFFQRIDFDALMAEVEESAGGARQALSADVLQIEGTDELKVLSPGTGIFYTSASPAEPDFVKVDQVVTTEDTLCLLEAMKLFRPLSLGTFNGRTELYPKGDYRVVRVNPSSGQAVNQGDLLFIIQPV